MKFNPKIGLVAVVIAAATGVSLIQLKKSGATTDAPGSSRHPRSSGSISESSSGSESIPASKSNRGASLKSVSELKRSLVEAMDSGDTSEAGQGLRLELIGELAKVMPAAELLQWLKDQSGDGADTGSLIPELFRQSQDSLASLCGLMKRLPPSQEALAMMGLTQRLEHHPDKSAFFGQLLAGEVSGSALQALTTALRLDLVRASDPEGRTSDLIATARELPPEAAKHYLSALVEALAAQSPRDVWLIGADPQFSSLISAENLRRAKDAALGDLLAANQRTAVEFLLENGGSGAEFSRAGLFWANSNPIQFEKWWQENSGALVPAQRDGLARGFAQHEAGKGNFLSAWDRLALISDSEAKRKAEGEVWKEELQSVTKEAHQNPQALIDSIVSGKSQHATYWIETAMSEWATKDSDAAWNWYQEKKEKLTPEQNEAVALSYARLALKNGDPEAAAQWAEFVVNPKSVEKIRQELAAAKK